MIDFALIRRKFERKWQREAAKKRMRFDAVSPIALPPALVRGLHLSGKFERLTAFQQRTLPMMMTDHDVFAVADNAGCGVTTALLLALLSKIDVLDPQGVQAVYLIPVRELVYQVATQARQLVQGMFPASARSDSADKQPRFLLSMTGGVPIRPQVERIRAGGISLILSTPGRFVDFAVQRRIVDLSHLRVVAVEEFDRMFEMGFGDTFEDLLAGISRFGVQKIFSAFLPRSESAFQQEDSQVGSILRRFFSKDMIWLCPDAIVSRTAATIPRDSAVLQLSQIANWSLTTVRGDGDDDVDVAAAKEAKLRKLLPAVLNMTLEHEKVRARQRRFATTTSSNNGQCVAVIFVDGQRFGAAERIRSLCRSAIANEDDIATMVITAADVVPDRVSHAQVREELRFIIAEGDDPRVAEQLARMQSNNVIHFAVVVNFDLPSTTGGGGEERMLRQYCARALVGEACGRNVILQQGADDRVPADVVAEVQSRVGNHVLVSRDDDDGDDADEDADNDADKLSAMNAKSRFWLTRTAFPWPSDCVSFCCEPEHSLWKSVIDKHTTMPMEALDDFL